MEVPAASLRSRLPIYCAGLVYLTVVALTIRHHEPWADEAQAWLLARDASLFELWTRLLHYEGTPGLWHTALHILIRFGAPYSGLNVFSGVLGCAASWVLVRYSPLPLIVRLLLPFTFFLCYQYTVVARSYSLLPLLVFSCALCFDTFVTRVTPLTVLLCLLAAVSVHGFVLSFSIALAAAMSIGHQWATLTANRARFAIAGAVYALVLVLMTLAAWPAKDVAFPFHVDLTFKRAWDISSFLFREAFSGSLPWSLVIVGLSIPFLWRGHGLLVFILSSLLLCAVSAAVYLQYWHVGILFLAWIFAMWVAAQNTHVDACASVALVVVIALQCYWTVQSVRYDWGHVYSGSRAAAQFLQSAELSKSQVYCAGYSCTAIQPYFPRNAFPNLNAAKSEAYWDWSNRNRPVDPQSLTLGAPDYVLVGYKAASEAVSLAELMQKKGYQRSDRFVGHLFWKTRELEPESYELYRRGSNPPELEAASVVNLSDPKTVSQLIKGFHGLESNAWRWTAREFSVTLKSPGKNAVLELRLTIPEIQIKTLGPMTLSAEVDGHPLEPQTFSNAGSYTYSRSIPGDLPNSHLIPVNFSFDKSTPPSAADSRELGAIVSAVGLYPKQP